MDTSRRIQNISFEDNKLRYEEKQRNSTKSANNLRNDQFQPNINRDKCTAH